MRVWIGYIEQAEIGAPVYMVGVFASLEALSEVLEDAFGPPQWRRTEEVPGVMRAALEWHLGDGMTVVVEAHEIQGPSGSSACVGHEGRPGRPVFGDHGECFHRSSLNFADMCRDGYVLWAAAQEIAERSSDRPRGQPAHIHAALDAHLQLCGKCRHALLGDDTVRRLLGRTNRRE